MTMPKKPSQRLRSKAEAIVSGHGRYPFFSLATLLHGGALLYGGAMKLRNTLYRRKYLPTHHLPCPVISVGNLTVGGTGKTPMTLHLAKLLTQLGYEVAVISRGYRSLSEKNGRVVSDGQAILCEAAQAGDEPYLMANLLAGVPVVVGKDRYAAGQTALTQFQPDVLLLDDAFQHQRLGRDLNLVLLDAQAPYGNGFILPRGPLRESMLSLNRANAVIFTRCQETPPIDHQDIVRQMQPRPVFHAFHKPVMRCIIPSGHPLRTSALLQPQNQQLHGDTKYLFAFSGLARNELFWETAKGFGETLVGTLGFDDHHPYTPDDIKQIVEKAQSAGSNCLVTTDKDFMRLPQKMLLPLDVMVLGIEIQFRGDQDRWQQFIASRVGELAVAKKTDVQTPHQSA